MSQLCNDNLNTLLIKLRKAENDLIQSRRTAAQAAETCRLMVHDVNLIEEEIAEIIQKELPGVDVLLKKAKQ